MKLNTVTKISPEIISGVSIELQRIVEQFFYAEAELLDQRFFTEWFDLLSDDIRYQLPVRSKVFAQEQREGHNAGYNGYVFDEDKHRMGVRLRKINSGRDVVERPPSMMRRLITNVRIQPLPNDECRALSYFHFTRIRHDYQVDTYTGERDDILRRDDNDYGWQIAHRLITLDQTVHLGGGIGFFF
jgi:biphenyl 2,3-dioxygenase beta subunit